MKYNEENVLGVVFTTSGGRMYTTIPDQFDNKVRVISYPSLTGTSAPYPKRKVAEYFNDPNFTWTPVNTELYEIY